MFQDEPYKTPEQRSWITEIVCPHCRPATDGTPLAVFFRARIVSNRDASHPDDTTHTLELECQYCDQQLGFAVNLAPTFDAITDALQTVDNT